MPPAATKIGSLSDVLVNAGDRLAHDPPIDTLAGFDVVAQFSHGLLNQQAVRSLAQKRLTKLSAYVPWGAVALPASLLAALPPRFALVLATGEARLELRLIQPYLSGLQWPLDISGGADSPISVSARRPGAGARIRSSSRTSSRVIGRSRTANVTWRLEINLLTARLDVGVLASSTSTGGAAPPVGGSASGVVLGPQGTAVLGDLADLAVSDTVAGDDGRSWNRRLLASGRAVTGAGAILDVPAGLWRFGMTLDFADIAVAVTSELPGVTEFLAAEGGVNLLTRALAPLRAASGVRLTPEVAPAGTISAAVAQRMHLPPFSVSDLLLTNDRGGPVLSLCAQLGPAVGGVLRLVRPFVGRQDFAYAASEEVLKHAYKTCWNLYAAGLTIVTDTPVELPVGDDPHVTETGRAQLSIGFSDVVEDVAIKALPEGRGDAVRLLSKQRLQLLNLWDHDGKRITDLGEMATPQEEAFVLPITLFNAVGAAPDALHPNFRALMLKLLAILVFPTVQPFSIRAQSISGFCSSAMKAVLVRWTLRTWMDDIRPPITDSVAERL